MALRPLMAQGDTSRGQGGKGSSRRCASCVDADTYPELLCFITECFITVFRTCIPELTSETSDASSSSATSSHVLGLRPGAPM
eukprot:11334808-Alexandrium_andersonii.AAC.1